MISTTDRPVRVALHIDHRVLRGSVQAALEQSPALEVVEECAVADVMVLDGSIPGPTSIESVRAMRSRYPESGLVLLSVHEDAAYVWRALEGGATGYVLADWAGRDLKDAVLAVQGGHVYVSPRLRWTAAKALGGAEWMRSDRMEPDGAPRAGG